MVLQRSRARARAIELWRAWTKPSPELTDRSLRWRARLLAALMLASLPLAAFITMLFYWAADATPGIPRETRVLPLMAMGVAYGLARTRHWQVGAWTVVLVVGAMSMAQMGQRGEPYLAIFVGLTIVLGAMILRKRDTQVLVGVTLLGFFTMPLWGLAPFSTLQQVLIGGFFVFLGLVLGISMDLRDTLERERLEALSKSESRFRGLLQVAFEGLVELRDGRIVELNPGFMEITGRTESELLGRELSTFMNLESTRRTLPGISSTASLSVRPGTKEASGTRPNGEVFHVELVSRTLSTERGPAEYVAVRDITRHRQAQLQLSIAHRAAALGTLSAGIAHEINDPLSWMMTNLQMAQDDLRRGRLGQRRTPEQDNLLRTLDDALQGGRRVMSVVRDLKTMAREGSGEGVADVHVALDLACRIASRQIEARARLVRDYGHVPSVRGTAGRLGQVFLNLLTNAAQAIPEGARESHRITLRTRRRRGDVEVIVRDTGRGIPAKVLPHIFDPFYTTKDKGKGTGLGLSITHSVIDGLGGTIEVESRQGQGTTFTLRLPVAGRQIEPAPETTAARPAAARLGTGTTSAGFGMTTAPAAGVSITAPSVSAAMGVSAATGTAVAPGVSATPGTAAATAASVSPGTAAATTASATATAAAATTAAATASATATATATATRVRVLVIDDEPLLGKSLRRALPEHDVVFTEDPARALELLVETEFDVIVCDLMMPIISGQDVYEHLEEHAPGLAARMIFMTGGAFTAGAQHFLGSIPNPVLSKPFTPNDLRVAVKAMMDSHAA